jgi:hypothetical protein
MIWIMEVRSTMHWCAHWASLPAIWPHHRFQRGFRNISSTNAVALFLAITYGFWIWYGYKVGAQCILLTLLGLAGIFLLIFTLVEYLRIPGILYPDPPLQVPPAVPAVPAAPVND